MNHLNTVENGGLFNYEDKINNFTTDLKPDQSSIHQNITMNGIFISGTDYTYSLGNVTEKGRELNISGLEGSWFLNETGDIIHYNKGETFVYKFSK
jgi:hypothetical protein